MSYMMLFSQSIILYYLNLLHLTLGICQTNTNSSIQHRLKKMLTCFDVMYNVNPKHERKRNSYIQFNLIFIIVVIPSLSTIINSHKYIWTLAHNIEWKWETSRWTYERWAKQMSNGFPKLKLELIDHACWVVFRIVHHKTIRLRY